MINRILRWSILGGSLVIVVVAGVCWVRAKRDAPPKRFTVQVSGAPGTRVSGTFEVDGLGQGEPDEAELPAEFTHTGHKLAFTVRRVDGPNLPISAALQIDGLARSVGTAAGGVRIHVWDGQAEPYFAAVESEPEWKETHEPGPRPDLIGTRPPEWTPVEWINSEPLRLADLRGRVVLVRWFTGPI